MTKGPRMWLMGGRGGGKGRETGRERGQVYFSVLPRTIWIEIRLKLYGGVQGRTKWRPGKIGLWLEPLWPYHELSALPRAVSSIIKGGDLSLWQRRSLLVLWAGITPLQGPWVENHFLLKDFFVVFFSISKKKCFRNEVHFGAQHYNQGIITWNCFHYSSNMSFPGFLGI